MEFWQSIWILSQSTVLDKNEHKQIELETFKIEKITEFHIYILFNSKEYCLVYSLFFFFLFFRLSLFVWEFYVSNWQHSHNTYISIDVGDSHNRGRSQKQTHHHFINSINYILEIENIFLDFISNFALVNEKPSVCYQFQYHPVWLRLCFDNIERIHRQLLFFYLFHSLTIWMFDIACKNEIISSIPYAFSWFNECVYFMLIKTFVFVMVSILRRIQSVIHSNSFRSFHFNSTTMAWFSEGVSNADLMNQLNGNLKFLFFFKIISKSNRIYKLFGSSALNQVIQQSLHNV